MEFAGRPKLAGTSAIIEGADGLIGPNGVIPHGRHLDGIRQGVVEMAARSEFAAAGLEEEVALGGGAPGTLGEDRDVPLGVLNHLQTGWHLNRRSGKGKGVIDSQATLSVCWSRQQIHG